jgi:hypothetical protein
MWSDSVIWVFVFVFLFTYLSKKKKKSGSARMDYNSYQSYFEFLITWFWYLRLIFLVFTWFPFLFCYPASHYISEQYVLFLLIAFWPKRIIRYILLIHGIVRFKGILNWQIQSNLRTILWVTGIKGFIL